MLCGLASALTNCLGRMDFWKGFIIAEVFIYCVYLIMGMVVYSAQGQFTYPVAYQGMCLLIQPYMLIV